MENTLNNTTPAAPRQARSPRPGFDGHTAVRRYNELIEESEQLLGLTLHTDTIDQLLIARGWTFEPARGGQSYTAPGRPSRAAGGKPGRDWYWDRGEALALALTYEADAVTEGGPR